MLNELPDDVLEYIYMMLPGKQLGVMAMVSTRMHRISKHVHPWLQKALSRHEPDSKTLLNIRNSFGKLLKGKLFQYQHSLDTYNNIEYWSKVCLSYMGKVNANGLYQAILNELLKREHTLRLQVVEAEALDRKITKEQRRVVCQQPEKQLIVVQAFAGTGKTTTLYHYAKKWKSHNMLYLAYNRALADESRKRFKGLENVHVMTIHSMALRNVDPNGEMALGNLKLNTIMEAFGNEISDIETAKTVLTEFNMYCSSDSVVDPVHPMVRKLWRCMFTDHTIKVTHDAYLKQYQRSMPLLREYDVLMLDEVQDCTDCILHIITSQSHSTRIFVGDVYQKIYGFRHVNEPFQYIMSNCNGNNREEASDCRCFQLSVSFRMGYDLMHYTNIYLKRAFHTQSGFSSTRRKQNTHVTKFDTHTDRIQDLPHGTVVLCRYNANVLQLMFQICNLQMSFGFYGKSIDFEKEIFLVTNVHYLHMGEMDKVTTPKLKGFATLSELYNHFVAVGNNPWKDRIQLYDRYGERLIQMWREAHEYVSAVDPHIVITTAHQSKGSEFDNVILYDDFPMNNDDAYNTLYVAMTRAKHRLYLNNSLFNFFRKLEKRVVYDDTICSFGSLSCSFCNKIKTNQSICIENDKKSIIEGLGCHLYEYVPICNICKSTVVV
jgi:F-box protein, helicase, 18